MKFFLQKGILLGFVVNTLVVLASGWLFIRQGKNHAEARSLVSEQKEITVLLEKVLAQANALGNNSKSYVLFKDEKYLAGLNQEALERDLYRLEKMASGKPDLQKKVGELKRTVELRIETSFKIIDASKKAGQEEVIRQLSEQNLQDIQRTNILVAQAEEDFISYYQERRQKLEKTDSVLKTAFLVSVIIALLLLITVFFIIRYHLRERIEAESRLAESKTLLQSIIDSMPMPVFIKKASGEYILVNKRFEILFNYKHDEVVGKTDHQLYSRDQADRFHTTDLEILKTGKEIKMEEEIRAGEELRTYLVSKFPIKDEHGKIYAIGGVSTDISEQARLGGSLKESEARLRMGFESAPDAIIEIDEEGKITRWNQKAETVFGWTAQEAIGRIMYELIMPEKYREEHKKGFRQFLATGEGPIINKSIEVHGLRKTGEEFDMELHVTFTKYENHYRFTGFIRDITKRKQLEKETQEAKAFLNSIIENIPDMIYVKDAKELKFISFNKAGEKLLGYSRNELIGKGDYDFFPKEQADSFLARDREVLDKKTKLDTPEEQINTKAGKTWVHTKRIPITDEKGMPQYLLGISEDITDKKRLEDERVKAEKQLQESEVRMSLILENIGEGVVVVNAKKQVVLSNLMAEEILEIEDFASYANWTSKYDIFSADKGIVFPSQNLPLERGLRGEATDDLEIQLRDRETGATKLIKVTGRPIRDKEGRVIAAVATIRDITKYKELEKALEESETKYRRLIGFGREEET